MIPIETTIFMPRKFTLYILLVVPAGLFITGLSAPVKDNSLLIISGISFLFFLLVFFLIRRTYVSVDNNEIIYKTAFREKSIAWKDITRSYFKVRHMGKSSQRLWHFEDITGKGVVFSTNLYSRKSLRAIAEALVEKSKNAEIEPKIRNIAEGRFPWYIF